MLIPAVILCTVVLGIAGSGSLAEGGPRGREGDWSNPIRHGRR
jgi:hypothetical protein